MKRYFGLSNNSDDRGNKKNDGGFIQVIVIIVVALVILRLLGFSILEILTKPGIREFATYIKDMLIAVWHDLVEIFNFFRSA